MTFRLNSWKNHRNIFVLSRIKNYRAIIFLILKEKEKKKNDWIQRWPWILNEEQCSTRGLIFKRGHSLRTTFSAASIRNNISIVFSSMIHCLLFVEFREHASNIPFERSIFDIRLIFNDPAFTPRTVLYWCLDLPIHNLAGSCHAKISSMFYGSVVHMKDSRVSGWNR